VTISAKLLAPVILIVMSNSACWAAPQDIFGLWMRGDGAAKVRIAPCGQSICATNTWIKDAAKQGEKVGDHLVFTIKPNGDGWSGKGYDPQRHLGFSATLKASDDRMVSGGCMLGGLMCKNTQWTRL
jgi:uncharacterized protein (DUF2147 family)